MNANGRRLEAPVRALLDWFARHARDLPWRRTRDPYAIWVSEVMLQQTQVKTVIPYWDRWMREFPGVEALADAEEGRVLRVWEGLGYYRRARHLQAAARVIRDQHQGRFPEDLEQILMLPGVGRYTAGAISSIAFGKPAPILDGNIIRVLCRWEARRGNPKDRTVNAFLWEEARRWVEAAAATRRTHACSHLNQALMELGATVCTPRSPSCDRCPVAGECQARARGKMEEYPELAVRARVSSREFVVGVIRDRGRVWVRQRKVDDVNGRLWEFPNMEVEPGQKGVKEILEAAWGEGNVVGLSPLTVVRHSITRYRITQRAYEGGWVGASRGLPGGGRWCRLVELEQLPMSSAHRRIATAWAGRRDELHLD